MSETNKALADPLDDLDDTPETAGTPSDTHDVPVPMDPGVVEPSKHIPFSVSGKDYLDFQWISDRLVFSGKLTPRQRDRQILSLALDCLRMRMQDIQEKQGSPFVSTASVLTSEKPERRRFYKGHDVTP